MQSKPSIKACAPKDLFLAWHEGVDEAAHNATLKHQLTDRVGELLPHFASYYEGLGALPRRARRNLQRQWKRSLAGIALLLVLGQAPALAATINVGGNCTLGRAITSANNNASPQGFCTPGSGADRIVLPANSTQTLTAVNNTVFGPTGLPVIRSVITISGNNSTIRRAPSAPAFRIFAVAGNGDLTLQATRVSGGTSLGGGGVYNSGGMVRLTNCIISANTATLGGGGVENEYDFTFFSGAILTLTNSTISGNSAGGGAGVSNGQYAGIRGTNSTIWGNTANGNGGGISNDSAVTLTNSTISGNTAGGDGGGVGQGYDSVSFQLTNSTMSGNTATSDGGAVYNSGGSVSLTHSTISGNMAGSRGGGVYNHFANADLGPGLVGLNRSLFAGNTASSGHEVFNDANATVSADNFNVLGHSGLTSTQAFVNFTPSGSDTNATSNGNRPTALGAILNASLANNGGPTRTHALVASSPAVDAVTNVNTCPPPARDQRGIVRPQDGNNDGGLACDTGSFERR